MNNSISFRCPKCESVVQNTTSKCKTCGCKYEQLIFVPEAGVYIFDKAPKNGKPWNSLEGVNLWFPVPERVRVLHVDPWAEHNMKDHTDWINDEKWIDLGAITFMDNNIKRIGRLKVRPRTKRCTKCHTDNPRDIRYCRECGRRVSSGLEKWSNALIIFAGLFLLMFLFSYITGYFGNLETLCTGILLFILVVGLTLRFLSSILDLITGYKQK